MNRRQFLASSIASVTALGAPLPLKIGHRQVNMMAEPSLAVFELAHRISGLSGVELHIILKDRSLWDRQTALSYKREANRWGLRVPSLSGIWTPEASLTKPAGREECLRKAIETAELLGASVLLVSALRANCPRMDDEASYVPAVETLRKMAPVAADVGVTLGLETSLSTADIKKLVDLVNHPAVRVFWDFDNLEFYGHKGQSVAGLDLLGVERICQVHCKNEDRLLAEPGRVDWAAAFAALKRIGYESWYVFETKHSSPEQCVEATRKNIEFMRLCLA